LLGVHLQRFGGKRDFIQGFADDCGKTLPLLGDRDPFTVAAEQHDAQFLFQGPDLMADRTWRHIDFFGRTRKAVVAGGRFEGAQGGEIRQFSEISHVI
jgi:hypothetical protein